MIICDKKDCGSRATYILNVDHSGHNGFHRIDLCQDHYAKIEQILEDDPKPSLEVKEDIVKQPLPKVQFEPEPQLKTPPQPKKRGRPKKVGA